MYEFFVGSVGAHPLTASSGQLQSCYCQNESRAAVHLGEHRTRCRRAAPPARARSLIAMLISKWADVLVAKLVISVVGAFLLGLLLELLADRGIDTGWSRTVRLGHNEGPRSCIDEVARRMVGDVPARPGVARGVGVLCSAARARHQPSIKGVSWT
jgi:hypothetical protein